MGSAIPGWANGGVRSLVEAGSEGWGQLNKVLVFNTWSNTRFNWTPVVTWEMDINTDASGNRTKDPDTALD